jgi:maltose O-acetyltransferase
MNLLRRWIRRAVRPLRADPVARLRRLGMQIGEGLSLQPAVVLDESHAWLISIGHDVTLAPRVVVLAHDASTKRALGVTRIGRVSIGDRVFIGGNSVVMPGVAIGDDAIVGAGSVVTADVPAGCVAAGNPARVIASTSDYLAKRQRQLQADPCFGPEFTLAGGISDERKQEMRERMAGRFGFVD